MCKLVFFVKDFSGTAVPRILKFGTNIGYDKLVALYIKESAIYGLSVPLFVHFSFFPINFSILSAQHL